MDIMLPIAVVGSALEGARRGFRTGGWLNKMIHGEGTYELAEGLRYMEKLFETQDIDFADKALQLFGRIKTTDKKYIVAQALYCEAMCYAIKGKYGLAYDSLDRVDAIEIKKKILGIGTSKPEVIRELQGHTSSLRSDIKNLESNGNILLQEYNEKKKLISSGGRPAQSSNQNEIINLIYEKIKIIENQVSGIVNSIATNNRQLNSVFNELRNSIDELRKADQDILRNTVNGKEELKSALDNTKNAVLSETKDSQGRITSRLYNTQEQINANKKLNIWILCIVSFLFVVAITSIVYVVFFSEFL
jgi:hypothetical protein